MIRRYKQTHNGSIKGFDDKNKIQLNDTHPAISTIELLRILIDEEKLSYQEAWSVVNATFAYTNHTVLPEALKETAAKLRQAMIGQ